MTYLRVLTPRGVDTAAAMLEGIRAGTIRSALLRELDSDEASVTTHFEFDEPTAAALESRWHLGSWLFKTFGESVPTMSSPAWSWLAMHFFEILCPTRNGQRKPGETARYLLEADDFRKAHRHLLAGPFLLIQAHRDTPEAVKGLLATAPDAPGEIYEQLAARKFIVTSSAVVRTATRMYLDKHSGKAKRGSGGAGAGSPRRFSDVLQQLDLTHDLSQLTEERLIEILPAEFNRFLA